MNRNDIPEMIERIKRAVGRSSRLMAQEVQGNIKQGAPVNHGNLQARWFIKQKGQDMTLITSDVNYALVQNDGSDPYTIYPRTSQALRFEIGGQVMFAKEVQHPGIAGTGYIDDGIEEADTRAGEFVNRALQEEGLI